MALYGYEISININRLFLVSQVEPVLELAMQDKAVQEAFPSWIEFEWLTYDVTDCDAAYAVISAIDAFNDCTHVFFGPACDFALGEFITAAHGPTRYSY